MLAAPLKTILIDGAAPFLSNGSSTLVLVPSAVTVTGTILTPVALSVTLSPLVLVSGRLIVHGPRASPGSIRSEVTSYSVQPGFAAPAVARRRQAKLFFDLFVPFLRDPN